MTKEEKEIALYCLKASSDYHLEVCEECVKYPNCDHTIQDDVTETIIKALEQQSDDCVSREAVINIVNNTIAKYIPTFIGPYEKIPLELARAIKDVPPVTPTHGTCKDCKHRTAIYADGDCFCEKDELLKPNMFYCAAFEKRGDENE